MGSERPCSSAAIRSFFITSKSLAGRVGSRRTWRRISRTAARLARLVWTVKVDAAQAASAASASSSAPAHAHAAVPSRAKFLSRASWICWRFRLLVPRIINSGRKLAASVRPLRFSALP